MGPTAITHQGIINKITESAIDVTIVSRSLCASCHAKGACSVSDIQEKTVTVYTNGVNSFREGETVDLLLKKSLGFVALGYAYLLPFIILLGTLLISLQFYGELFSGILSFAVLIPYYTVLYTFRNKLKKTFTFQIEKHKS